MGGYVIRKLKEKDQQDVGFLDKEYLESQSSDWINAIDRGDLVHITDSCFQLFLAIEMVTRQEMKATAAVMDNSFCQHLENMITSDSDVLFCWTLITNIDNIDNATEIGRQSRQPFYLSVCTPDQSFHTDVCLFSSCTQFNIISIWQHSAADT